MPNGGALGALEVYGWPPFLEAADAMLKAANVVPVGMDSVGIALLTLLVQGDVGAVRTAVEAGASVAQRTTKAMSSILPNPVVPLSVLLKESRPGKEMGPEAAGEGLYGPPLALGALQTEGLLPLVEAGDAMLKAANVRLTRYQWVGLRCHTMSFIGEIGDARTALDAGMQVAKRNSKEVMGMVLANPSPILVSVLGLRDLFSQEIASGRQMGILPSLGILEAKGMAASTEGTDVMFKSARVRPIKFIRLGLAWLATFVTGELGAVQSAVEAGVAAASRRDECYGTVIPNPASEVFDLFELGTEGGKA